MDSMLLTLGWGTKILQRWGKKKRKGKKEGREEGEEIRKEFFFKSCLASSGPLA